MLEKCINSQLLDYFENHELLTCNQSAFRKHHSTLTASHKLVDDLLDNMNKKLINGACFFLSKKSVLTQLITHSYYQNSKKMVFDIRSYFGLVITFKIVHKLLKLMEIARHVIT